MSSFPPVAKAERAWLWRRSRAGAVLSLSHSSHVPTRSRTTGTGAQVVLSWPEPRASQGSRTTSTETGAAAERFVVIYCRAVTQVTWIRPPGHVRVTDLPFDIWASDQNVPIYGLHPKMGRKKYARGEWKTQGSSLQELQTASWRQTSSPAL